MFVRRTLAALALGAALAGGTATAASAGVPENTATTAEGALQIRSEALNTRYDSAAPGLAPGALDALVVRSEGMNRYGETQQAATPVAAASGSTTFAWDEFGIGMAAAFALILLAGGLAVAVRTGARRQARFPS